MANRPPALDPSERLRWAEIRDELPFTALAPLRSSAEKWGASITGLLGIFGTVAFITGPEALTDVSAVLRLPVAIAITVAGVLAGIAIVTAALAAQGVPTWRHNLSPEVLADDTKRAQQSTVRFLAASRWLALTAALLLFASTAGVWLLEAVAKPEPAHVRVVVIANDGTARCGIVSSETHGDLQLRTSASAQPEPLDDVLQLTEVEACPSP